MERNNIVTAPQMVDAEKHFRAWRDTHAGSRLDFYRFMTTPSEDRRRFLATRQTGIVVKKGLVSGTIY